MHWILIPCWNTGNINIINNNMGQTISVHYHHAPFWVLRTSGGHLCYLLVDSAMRRHPIVKYDLKKHLLDNFLFAGSF
jgi:hypothetical protein